MTRMSWTRMEHFGNSGMGFKKKKIPLKPLPVPNRATDKNKTSWETLTADKLKFHSENMCICASILTWRLKKNLTTCFKNCIIITLLNKYVLTFSKNHYFVDFHSRIVPRISIWVSEVIVPDRDILTNHRTFTLVPEHKEEFRIS